ncbi:hypothetical protein B6S44_22500 [Bosea sp. Tri-44]|uniref:hypothetical protein n=1 Tax=Bosea sp. Tri-44 TaxID=1972137 RepID=UPI00100DE62D|nr:hypothetical protein [Bosea sp. Tri-44]RXT50917.1 hypothetical protein B6S44_22500 [Bosea sp. Tri-44]
MPEGLEITFDFTAVQGSAESVRAMLLALRERFDLSPYEYTRKVRIAPTEIPHSHPLTLNTWVRDETALLHSYLHEQMHWYVTWYSHTKREQWTRLLKQLRERYPQVPVGGSDGAADVYSTYLHVIVNWLEVETVADFLGRETAERHVSGLPFYRWPYRIVRDDRDALRALYAHELLPIVRAVHMSTEDLTLAGRLDEARE